MNDEDEQVLHVRTSEQQKSVPSVLISGFLHTVKEYNSDFSVSRSRSRKVMFMLCFCIQQTLLSKVTYK